MVLSAEIMEISVSDVGGELTLVVKGEIDYTTAPRLKDAIQGLAERQSQPIRLDLREVSFIDSSGIGVLVAARKSLSATGTLLNLIAASPTVLRVIELLGLGSVFAIGDGP